MKNAGCFPSFTAPSRSASSLKQPESHCRELFAYLRSRPIPLLGLTEPTLCGFGQRRLHEDDPAHTEIGQNRSLHDILIQHMDFVQVQQLIQGPGAVIQLPRMVQFELAWITEQLPQSRAQATHDQDYCFFHREAAEAVLLDHIQQLDRHGITISLVWHHYHPIYGDTSATEIATNPFAPVEGEAIQATLRQMMQHLNASDISHLNAQTQSFIQTQRQKLDRIAAFAQQLEALDIQLIFRPYHEHSGHWFWWGLPTLGLDPSAAHQLFSQFWTNTRRYLEQQGVQNFLYAYSPDVPDQLETDEDQFRQHYEQGCVPEDIDIMGLDFYLDKHLQHPFTAGQMQTVSKTCLQYLSWIHQMYPQHIVALTETGIRFNELNIEPTTEEEGTTFWQQYFLPLLQNQYHELPLAYLTLWRNSPGDYIHPHPNSSDRFLSEIMALIEYLDTVPYPVTNTTETIIS